MFHLYFIRNSEFFVHNVVISSFNAIYNSFIFRIYVFL
jgi:hypothetical protein